MKLFPLILSMLVFTACKQPSGETQKLQSKIDSLEKQLAETYKPGFGEFMSGIQMHHAKLWFAGLNENWPLADFEIHEIKEALEDVQKFCSDRPEVRSMKMIDMPVDSITMAIKDKNLSAFKKNFIFLTTTCNNCHKETNHEFNVVTVPVNLPVVNQDFKPTQ